MNNLIKGLSTLLFLLLAATSAFSQVPNSLDTTFNFGLPIGQLNTGFGTDGQVRAVKQLSNGKILIGGDFNYVHGVVRNNFAQLNADGTLDLAFGSNNAGFNYSVNGIAVQADGKIIVVGEFNRFNNVNLRGIVKLNADGTQDLNFNPGTGFSYSQSTGRIGPQAVAVQPDGKIVVVGTFAQYNSVSAVNAVRLFSNGNKDNTFDIAAGFNGSVFDILLQPDGKILVCGQFTSINGSNYEKLCRLEANGQVDASFQPSANRFNSNITTIHKLALTANGKLIVAGAFNYDLQKPRINMARLNMDGSLDTMFNRAGNSSFNGPVLDFQVLPSGKLLVAGNFSFIGPDYRNSIARLDSLGRVDATFYPNNGIPNQPQFDPRLCLAVLPDSTFIVGGKFSAVDNITRFNISKFRSNGVLDMSFMPAPFISGLINTIDADARGRVYIGGRFKFRSESMFRHIARLDSNGAIDTAFNNSAYVDTTVTKLKVAANGKVVLVGPFRLASGKSSPLLAAFYADGTIDTVFSNKLVTNFTGVRVADVKIQADGKVLIVGSLRVKRVVYTAPTQADFVVRLKANGDLDSSFNRATGLANQGAITAAVLSDGKFLVSYNTGLLRYNANGTLDMNYSTSSFVSIASIPASRSNRVFAATFRNSNTVSAFLPNGQSDGGFTFSPLHSPNVSNIQVLSLAAQTDSCIIVAGSYNSNSTSVIHSPIARRSFNGAADLTFGPNQTVHGTIREMVVLPNNKILLAGDFFGYGGYATGPIARLMGGLTAVTSVNEQLASLKLALTLAPNPATAEVAIMGLNEEQTPYTLINNLGQVIRRGKASASDNKLPLQGLPSGLYTVAMERERLRLVVE